MYNGQRTSRSYITEDETHKFFSQHLRCSGYLILGGYSKDVSGFSSARFHRAKTYE
jgi:hypothetical protein